MAKKKARKAKATRKAATKKGAIVYRGLTEKEWHKEHAFLSKALGKAEAALQRIEDIKARKADKE